MEQIKQSVISPWTEEQWEKWIYSFALDIDHEKERTTVPLTAQSTGNEDR